VIAAAPSRLNAPARRIFLLILVLGIGAFAGTVGMEQPKFAVAVAGAFVAAAVVLTRSESRRAAETYRWIPFAWMALFLSTDLSFRHDDPLAIATGTVNIQHVLELCTYAAVAGLIIRSRYRLLPLYPQPVPKGLLLAWPIVAVVSTLWSQIPLFTLARALQLVVIGSLALLVVRIWLSDRLAGERVWTGTLRVFVQVVTVLALVGLLIGPEAYARFSWPGLHPGVAATYLGTATLILVAGGRSLTGFSLFSYWGRLLLFGLTIYLGQTRSAIAALVLAVGVGLWFRGRESPVHRYLGVAYYIVGIGILLGVAASPLLDYLSRGEGAESIATLNGRIPLWRFALAQPDSPLEWLTGFGYSASRSLLLPYVEWAGTAHSAWMELLLGVGVLGLALGAADVLLVTLRLIQTRFFGAQNAVAIAVLAFLLVTSVVSDSLALPGIGFGLLALIHAPALTQRGWQSLSTLDQEPAALSGRDMR
jgi:hypothetical protein